MAALELPTLRKIEKLAEEIVEKFRPQRIILFGSWAHGKPTDDSDADLLIIMKTPEGALRQGATISKSLDHIFPLDIVVKNPEEVKRRLEEGDAFLKEVLTKGKVLYEADSTSSLNVGSV